MKVPRSLLITSVASASPSTSSAMISSGLPWLEHLLQHRHQVLVAGDLLLVDQDVRVFQLALHLLRVGDEVRRQIAAIELHALDELVVGLQGLAFLDGDDAVLADLRPSPRR